MFIILKKNCPGNTCMQDTDDYKNSRATFADFDVAINRLY